MLVVAPECRRKERDRTCGGPPPLSSPQIGAKQGHPFAVQNTSPAQRKKLLRGFNLRRMGPTPGVDQDGVGESAALVVGRSPGTRHRPARRLPPMSRAAQGTVAIFLRNHDERQPKGPLEVRWRETTLNDRRPFPRPLDGRG
jgi:hypothetical protein